MSKGLVLPTRESLGALHLRAGQLEEARKVFREDIEHNPGNARSIFGCGRLPWQVLPTIGDARAQAAVLDRWRCRC